MKKFLICLLFLIPIIIVLAISASGNLVALSGTPVNPQSIEIRDLDNQILAEDKVVTIDANGIQKTFVFINVYPTIAKDHSVTFQKVEEAGSGQVEFEKDVTSNKYYIKPIARGIAQYVVIASSNVNVKTMITFKVSTDKLEGITIYNQSGEELSSNYDLIGEETFSCEINPFEALSGNSLFWSSSNENVIKVGKNGEVYPVAKGNALVQVVAYDKTGDVVVDSVMVSTQNAKIKNYGDSSDGSSIIFTDKLEQIYTNNGIYYVTLGHPNDIFNEINGATYESSAPNVVAVVGTEGQIKPLASGQAVITASYNGQSVSKTIVVRERPDTFELELGVTDSTGGISMSRVWGNKFFDGDSTLIQETSFGLKDKQNKFDVVWSVNDDSYAEIMRKEEGQDIVIRFLDASCGQAVTVTATLKLGNRLIENVKRSFTFNMIDNLNSVNVTNEKQFRFVNNVMAEQFDVVLQDGFYAEQQLIATCSIYGNGFTIDGDNIKQFTYYWDPVIYYDDKNMRKDGKGNPLLEELVVYDLKVKRQDDYDADVSGYCFKFVDVKVPIIFKHVEAEHGRVGAEFYGCYEALIEGCIFGDNGQTGCKIITAEPTRYKYEEGYPKFTFRNNVYKKSKAPSVIVTTYNDDFTRENNPIVYVEGFQDIYNWKKRSEITKMILYILQTGDGLGDNYDAFSKIAENALKKIAEEGTMGEMFMKYKNEDYFSPGFFFMGATFYIDIEKIHINAENMQLQEIKLKDANGNTIKALKTVESLLPKVAPQIKTLSNTSYMLSMKYDADGMYIMPDDPVPESRELYTRLQGR